MTLTVVAKRSVSVKKRKKVRSVINITYCLIHPKAIFKKLLIYSRVSKWSDDVKVKASRYVVSSRRGGGII